jgi:hypothetical protein
MDAGEAGSSEQAQKLATQIKSANTELTRLVDAYQAGAIELAELQKRRRRVDSKLDTLNREKELLEKMTAEQRHEGDVRANLQEFAALVSSHLHDFSFEENQKLLRMVLDKVVVKDWRVDVHYNIPLPRPPIRRNRECQPILIYVAHVLPRRPCNSITHSDRPAVGDGISSRNAGGAMGRERRAVGVLTIRDFTTGLADSISRLSLPYSKCRACAVGETPCSRANSTAAAHKRSGIGKRAVWALRHRSKRR